MTATALPAHRVTKPWGRRTLAAGFTDCAPHEEAVGEVWFEPGSDAAPLMVKYLFTADRLSIQVHPGDAAARLAGYPRGKDEAWIILAADPGATIALGPKRPTTRTALATAARDGSIERLLDWRPAVAGDVIYLPAGTVHALGAGLTLIEIQQNVDLTYRLYDYGRQRALHVDAGAAVADTSPFLAAKPRAFRTAREVVADGAAFTVERWSAGTYHVRVDGSGSLFVPVAGGGQINGHSLQPGQCWSCSGDIRITLKAGAKALFASPSGTVPIVAVDFR